MADYQMVKYFPVNFYFNLVFFPPQAIINAIINCDDDAHNNDNKIIMIIIILIIIVKKNLMFALQLPRKQHRSTRLLQPTGRWQYDGII